MLKFIRILLQGGAPRDGEFSPVYTYFEPHSTFYITFLLKMRLKNEAEESGKRPPGEPAGTEKEKKRRQRETG